MNSTAPSPSTLTSAPARAIAVAMVSPGWPTDAYANGIIPYVADVAHELRQAGHSATVLAMKSATDVDGVLVRNIASGMVASSLVERATDVVAYRVATSLGDRIRMTRTLASAIRRLIDEVGLELVEIEDTFGLAARLRDLVPIPIVVRLHGPWFLNGPLQGATGSARDRGRIAIEGKGIRRATAVTAPSVDVLERTRAYYGLALEGALAIPPPTPRVPLEERWSETGAEPETLVYVGRFDRHKGGDVVVEAFARLASRRPGARLRFIGPDRGFRDDSGRTWSFPEYLEHKAPGLAGSGRVEFVGSLPKATLPAERRKGAAVVVGSRYETLCLAAVEAMALGCPLVAPRTGGIPEFVEHGVNGLLFEPANPEALADQLERILEDRPLATTLGRKAGEDCQTRFDPVSIASRLADYYRDVIDRSTGGASR
jgi:glycosyltransferase involved in cell wall biosynthesis